MSDHELVVRLAGPEDAAAIAALSDELNEGQGEPTGEEKRNVYAPTAEDSADGRAKDKP